MKYSSSFIVYVLLIQFFSIFSSNEFPQTYNNNTPHVEMNVNRHQGVHSSGGCYVSSRLVEVPDRSYEYPANYSIVAHSGSAELNKHFNAVVAPMIYNVTVKNHYCAVPGSVLPQGLRDCFVQLSQFSSADALVIKDINKRLETYCTHIENVLFDSNGIFRQTISPGAQAKLAKVFANFIKEFYPEIAQSTFLHESTHNPILQHAMSAIDWRCYDGKDYANSDKTVKKIYAAEFNNNLGAVHKALHVGDSKKAYTIGQQRVVIAVSKIRKTETVASVFERYPYLHKTVEQAYQADKAKAEQERMAKQVAVQQNAALVQAECKSPCLGSAVGLAAVEQRYNAATGNVVNPQFFKQIHAVALKDAVHINSEHLTKDRKGIIIDGGYLQHHLVDEAVSVVDTATSCDLAATIQDAVIDLANVSLTSNKDGDVVTASRTLDACWAIIDFTQRAARYAHNSLSVNLPVVAAMIDGVGESLHGAAHAVCHPVETAQDVVNSFVVAGYYLGRATYAIAEHSAVCDMIEMHPEHAEQMIQEHSCDPTVFFAAYEQATTISAQDVARVCTKTVADMMLLHGVTNVVSAIAKQSIPAFLSCMRKGSQSADVAITVEGIPVRCAEEVSSLMGNVKKAGGSAIAESLVNSRTLIESMTTNLLQDVRLEIVELKKKFDCMQNCVVDCAKKGFAEFSNKHIKIPYEHILGIELKWNEAKNTLSGISGFHHDFMGAVENSGLLTFVKKGVEKNGCYLADIIVDNARVPGKTFFPQNWSREKTISKIHEAYDNFIKNGATAYVEKRGKYVLQGMTEEGIKIEMYITRNGQILTAYPVVEMGAGI